MRARQQRGTALVSILALTLAACGGGGGATGNGPASQVSGGGVGGVASGSAAPASVFAKPAAEALTSAEVETVVARAVAEAQARGVVLETAMGAIRQFDRAVAAGSGEQDMAALVEVLRPPGAAQT